MTTDKITLGKRLVVTEIGDLEEYGKSVFLDTFKPIDYTERSISSIVCKVLLALAWLFALTYNLLV